MLLNEVAKIVSSEEQLLNICAALGMPERFSKPGLHADAEQARICDGGLDDAEGEESASRIKHRCNTYGRELVPLMVEARGDDPMGLRIIHGKKSDHIL